MKPSLNTAIHDATVTKVPICIEGHKMSVPQNSSVPNENALLNHSLSNSSTNSTITIQNGAFIPCFSSIDPMPKGTMDVNNEMPCPPTPLTMENNKYAHGWLTHQTNDSEDYCKSNVNIHEQVGKWQVSMAKQAVVRLSTSVVPDNLESAMTFETPIDTQQQNTKIAGAVISSEKDINQHLTIEEHVDLEVNCIDMNKTPPRKPKRKKHRPKVIQECKPKRTLKSTPPTSVTLKTPMNKEETPSGKRKYVRKKRVQDPFDNPSDVLEETAYISSLNGSKSTRRRLNFDLEVAKVRDEPPRCALSVMQNEECLATETCFMEINDKSSTNLSMQCAQGIEIVTNNSPNRIQFTPADGLMHKEAEHTSFPQEKTPTYQSSGEGIITISQTHEGCEITSEDANKSSQQSKVKSIYNDYYELTRKNDHLMIARIEKSWKSAPDQINTNQMLNMLLGSGKRRHNFSKDAPILEEKNGTETYERVSQFNDASHEDPYLPQGYKKQRAELVQSRFDPSAFTSSVQKPSNRRRKSKATCNRGEQLALSSEMQYDEPQ